MSDSTGWTGMPSVLGGGSLSTTASNLVTLIEGSTFCISAQNGNIVPGAPMGLFVRDTRLLSEWMLEVDGDRLEPLAATSGEAYVAVFLARTHSNRGHPESTLLVVREREVGDGLRERIRVQNVAPEMTGLTLTLRVAADFADLFEVKEGRVSHPSAVVATALADGVELTQQRQRRSRSIRVTTGSAPSFRGTGEEGVLVDTEGGSGTLTWHLAVPARGEWAATVEVEAYVDGRRLDPLEHDGEATVTIASRRTREWRETVPDLHTPDATLTRTLAHSVADLGALRIFDPDHADRTAVAAGAPWFMALFGRDSLLTSWMLLPLDASLALGTLRSLAEHQGTRTDPLTDEQPGRILHEMRLGRLSVPPREGGVHVSYSSVDATPLFVMLLGELRRWGLAWSDVEDLLPAADRALEWIVTLGDRDGDGFVEYQRATDRGMRNQGWKDSRDGISFADGTLAEPPIALCEVQGYVYGAFLARAHFAREAHDEPLAREWAQRAAALKAAFNERFWLPEKGWFAIGLDRDKRPIDALASNMGHCLWTGIVDEEKAPAVANHLLSPDMFTGWGVRTLARSMGRYNPVSYHNGSVWPHDSAVIAAGLARYGFVHEAQIVAQGLLAASDRFDNRLPELFCGFDRREFDVPVPYPTACSPQAWAAAAPVMLLRALMRIDPWIPSGELRVAPALPASFLPLRLDRVAMAGRRVSVEIVDGSVAISGLGPEITVIPEPRAPGTAMLP
ncbi:MAG TPA: glycogen debranching N-terminal domain-containing protein [Candidatus Angelobacter sp.]|nr:glycogen debranching N-terminal domain-containing protein [Candidatus Angelobacter sp.]